MFCSTAWTSLHRIRTCVEFCHRATLDSVIARRRRLSGHKTNIDSSFLLLLTVLFMFTPTSNSTILQYISILNKFWLQNCTHNCQCQQSWTKYPNIANTSGSVCFCCDTLFPAINTRARVWRWPDLVQLLTDIQASIGYILIDLTWLTIHNPWPRYWVRVHWFRGESWILYKHTDLAGKTHQRTPRGNIANKWPSEIHHMYLISLN